MMKKRFLKKGLSLGLVFMMCMSIVQPIHAQNIQEGNDNAEIKIADEQDSTENNNEFEEVGLLEPSEEKTQKEDIAADISEENGDAAADASEESKDVVAEVQNEENAVEIPTENEATMEVPDETTAPVTENEDEATLENAADESQKAVSDEGNDSANVANSFRIEGTVLKEYTGTGGAVTIPDYITKIDYGAFRNAGGVTSVRIPGSVKIIDRYAFSGCYGIVTVTFSSGLTEIGYNAFDGCTALRSVTIPNTVVDIGSSAFSGCTALGSVKLGTGLKTIGNGAFYKTALTSVTIPDSVNDLGESVFRYCNSLTTAKIGNGVLELKYRVFNDCENLSSVTFGNNIVQIGNYAFSGCGNLKSIAIPNSVKSIGYEAFCNNVKLTSVQLGTNVETIDGYAFSGCSNLSTINWNSKIRSLGNYAFQSIAITAVTLPNSVTSIGEGVFRNCTSLKNAVLGTGLTSIPYRAFSGCTLLQKVTINGLPTLIGQYAFSNCVSLTDINIPDSVTRIDYGAFEVCTSLKVLRLGNGITNIGGYAFSGCTSLETLYMPFYLSEWGSNVTNKCPNVTAYIYSGAAKAIQWAQEQNVRYTLIGDFKPNAVTGLKASPCGKNKVRLTWNESFGAEGYLIYGQKNGTYGYVGMTTTGISFTDTKALDTTYNYYWVFPYVTNNAGKMVPGGTPKYVYAKGVIPAVTNLKASSVTGGVKLAWMKRADATGYLIYGIRGDNGKYEYVGMTTKGTTFTDTKAYKTQYNFYWVFPYHKNSAGKMIVGGTPQYVYGRAK